jgi:PadR family transcriptional regulator PadR
LVCGPAAHIVALRDYMRHNDHDGLYEQEQMVLLAILRLGSGAYGVPILEELSTITGFRLSRPSIYMTLARLRRKGLLTSEVGEPLPERGGRARRFYGVTPGALALLRTSRRSYLRLWSGLEAVLDHA